MSCENHPIPGTYYSLGLTTDPVSFNPIARALGINLLLNLDVSVPNAMSNTLILGASIQIPGVARVRGETSFDKGGNPFGTTISGEGGVAIKLGGITLGSSTIKVSGSEVTITLPDGSKTTYEADTIRTEVEADMRRFTSDPAKAAAAGVAAEALVEGIGTFEENAESAANSLRDALPDSCDRPDGPIKQPITNPAYSPLVLDLDGDGIELTSLEGTSVFFDLNANGFAAATGWVAADDGLLALDVDGDGWIENGSELFGDQTGHAHGFLALAEHDDNGDGVIDASDAVFADLLVWQDLNGDGVNQQDETRGLVDAGIASISVNATATNYQVAGNDVLWESSFTRADGTTGTVADAYFKSDPGSSVPLLPDDFSYHEDAFILPVLSGSGEIASTIVALSHDADLRTQGRSLISQLENGDVTGFYSDFEAYLFQWTGVGDIDPSSRGPNVDARHLTLIERFVGVGFDNGENLSPGVNQGEDLEIAYDGLLSRFALRFIAQSAGASDKIGTITADEHPLSAFNGIIETVLGPEGSLTADVSSVLTELQTYIENGSITTGNALFALDLLRVDLGNSNSEHSALLSAAAAQSGLNNHTALYVGIEHYGGRQVLAGSVAADNLNSGGSSTFHGDAGDDVILGGDGGNTIWGGSGNDTIQSGKYSDTYIYYLGDGSDIITDYDAGAQSGTDTLRFVDIASDEVGFIRGTGTDLVVSVGDGEAITIKNHFDDDSDFAIDAFTFSDSVSLNAQNVRDRTVAEAKSSGVVRGSGLVENYEHALGDGSYVIYDWDNNHRTDTLTFTDQDAVDVSFAQASGNDLVMTLSNGETVRIYNQFLRDLDEQIEQIIFADGELLDSQAIRDKRVADMKVTGVVIGTELAENYIHSLGDGSYTVTDYDAGSNSATDLFKFNDLNADGVVFSHGTGNDLVMTLANGEAITVKNHFQKDWDYKIDTIGFADGTILNAQQTRDKTVSDMKATGVVVGSELAENYLHSLGDGSYTITDYDPGSNSATDFFLFNDVNSDDVIFSRGAGNDLIMELSNGETVTVKRHFDSDWDYKVDTIGFADGTVLGSAAIDAKVLDDFANANWDSVSTILEAGEVDEFQFGNGWNGLTDPDGRVDVGFINDGSSRQLTLTVFDMDTDDEMAVWINGQHHSYLPQGQNNGTYSHTIDFVAGELDDGENIISIVNQNAAYYWGIDDLHIV